jgi:hypothetical protein
MTFQTGSNFATGIANRGRFSFGGSQLTLTNTHGEVMGFDVEPIMYRFDCVGIRLVEVNPVMSNIPVKCTPQK